MEWNVPFIVYRMTEDNQVVEVFHCQDITKAKYWMTYIAHPGDVLVKTPLHPKHSKATKICEYWSHKDRSGKTVIDLKRWSEMLSEKNLAPVFPEEQQSVPAS